MSLSSAKTLINTLDQLAEAVEQAEKLPMSSKEALEKAGKDWAASKGRSYEGGGSIDLT